MQRMVTTALMAAFFSSPILAQTTSQAPFEGAYLGAGIGQSKLHSNDLDQLEDFGYSVDDSDTAYQLFLGYQFNPHFSMEASYIDFGEFSASYSGYYGQERDELSLDGFGAALVGRLPIQEGFSFHGKLGVIAWDADLDISVGNYFSVSGSDDGTDPFYGLGAEYTVNNIMIRGEYVRYAIDSDNIEVDADILSASLGYRF